MITLIGTAVSGLIVLGILLVVLDANPKNDIVEWVTDSARWLAGPFKDLFEIKNRDWRVVVNWGLAAIVYSVIAGVVARLAARTP